MIRLALVLLVACTPAIDTSSRVPARDAGPDSACSVDVSPPDAACWMYEIVQCNDTLIQLCVPMTGCASYQCNGQWYGYCGPGN